MSQTRWLERAVDALDVALLLVAADRKVAYANAAAHRLFGLLPGHLLSMSIERLVVPERRGELRNFDDVLSGGGARKVRSVLRREDGARVDVTMVLEPCFDDNAGVSGVSVRYYDAPQQSMRPSLAGSRPPLGMEGASGPMPSLAPSAAGHASAGPARYSGPVGASSAAGTPPPLPGHASPPAPAASSDPSRSASRLSPARLPDAQRTRLTRALRNLQWLEERLSAPSGTSQDERGHALLAASETRGLVEEALGALDAEAEEIPPAPRMPRV